MNNVTGVHLGVYEIEDQLGHGNMGVVYRAKNRLNGQTVALKQIMGNFAAPVSQDATEPEFNYRAGLAREFQVLASLRHPHIISVMDYGFDSVQQPYFTMQLLENNRTIKEAAASKPDSEIVRLLIEMLQALAYLHRHNIIHRDLKPDNVLVDPQGSVKVVDFGLAHLIGDQYTPAGTPHYAAPEVFVEDPIYFSTDLYTVGVIAYELFTRRYPFDGASPIEIYNKIISTIPDYSGIDDYFVAVLEKLLNKDPLKRYQNADEVIRAFSDAADLPTPKENEVLRESFLQAARFIGRKGQLQTLFHALEAAKTEHGSAWLLGGESGVGKSRLMDELAIEAQVGGILVLRGQGVAEGGVPYQLWGSIVQRLALMTELSDLEASILKAVVPDIGQLLKRTLPEAPRFEDGSGQQQLVQTLIEVMTRIQQPILLLLEDLHWSEESLDILRHINKVAPEFHLLIVASYRDDERPDLPSLLTDMKPMKLERLSTEEIHQLSQSMIGEGEASQPAIAQFLEKQTEGNVLFLVEVVRALAQEAGGLDKIGQLERLPDYILTGGVRKILQQRLGHVPEDVRPLLRLAAIASRFLDLKVLTSALQNNPQLYLEPEKSTAEILEKWLTLCVNATVVERFDDRWRFTHDKLRETLIEAIPQEDKMNLHRLIAGAIEASYPADDAQAAVLADHWHYANEAGKEAYYLRKAGAAAAASYAYDQALGFLERALAITPASDPSGQAEINLEWGMVLMRQSKFQAARSYLEAALQLSEGTERVKAYSLRNLGVVTARLREPGSASDYNERALELFRKIDDRSGQSLALRDRGNMRRMHEDYSGARSNYLQALALSQEVGDKNGESSILNNLAIIADDKGNFSEADKYLTRALEIKREIGDRHSEVPILNNLGYFALARGKYTQAMDYMEAARLGARGIRDPEEEAQALHNLGVLATTEGRYVEAQSLFEESLQMRRGIEHQEGECETLGCLGWLQHLHGQSQTGLDLLQQALKIAFDIEVQSEETRSLTYLGHISADLGQFEAAVRYYQQALSAEEEIDHQHRAIERTAGLAGVAQAEGQLARAVIHVNEVLEHLEHHSIDGLDEPFRLYLGCYNILKAAQDERAGSVLKRGYDQLMLRSKDIHDENHRNSYLERVLAHHNLVTLWNAQQL